MTDEAEPSHMTTEPDLPAPPVPKRKTLTDLGEAVSAVHAEMRAMGWHAGAAMGTVKRNEVGEEIASRDDYAFVQDVHVAKERVGIAQIVAKLPRRAPDPDDED